MTTMAERAFEAMKADPDQFRRWTAEDLRRAAGVKLRSRYALYEQVSDMPGVEYCAHGHGLQIAHD
jgi:hypothetical protein